MDGIVQHDLHGVVHLGQIHCRRGNADTYFLLYGHAAQFMHERIVILQTAVHFPVADYPFFIPHRSNPRFRTGVIVPEFVGSQ